MPSFLNNLKRFKEALKDFLPAETIQKRKHGFGLPFGYWSISHPPLKALVDEAPKAVKEGVAKEEADKIQAQLEEAGAQVELK